MLDEAFRLGCEYLGLRSRTALCCEWESYAAACLLARMEEQSMEPAPIWCGDLRDLDCRPFRGSVDAIIAGLPCQPYSCAGKQKGLADERSYGDGDGPIPNFLRIVAECQPSLVFCENVPPWVRGGWFRPVGEELCGMGYTLTEPLFVTAESVGASHRRERVFVLAHRTGGRLGRLWQSPRGDGFADGRNEELANARRQRRSKNTRSALGDETANGRAGRIGSEPNSDHEPERVDANVDDAAGPRSAHASERGKQSEADRQSGMPRSGERCADAVDNAVSSGRRIDKPGRRSDRRTAPGRAGEGMANAERSRPQGDGPAIEERRDVTEPRNTDWGIFAPGPGADWASIPEHLWPAVKPGFRVLADGMALVLDESRTDQLRCGGNGVVPLAAAVAFVELMRGAKLA